MKYVVVDLEMNYTARKSEVKRNAQFVSFLCYNGMRGLQGFRDG